MQCVSHEIFYQRLDDFKQKQKRNTSKLTMFIEDQFYNGAMEYLKIQSEKSSSDSREMEARGRDSHMKQTGMLVVSLRGVNFRFWSRLGCAGQSANILSR